jgi:hypothetical protein
MAARLRSDFQGSEGAGQAHHYEKDLFVLLPVASGQLMRRSTDVGTHIHTDRAYLESVCFTSNVTRKREQKRQKKTSGECCN